MSILGRSIGLLPAGVESAIRKAFGRERHDFGEQELGEFVLDEVAAFSRSRGGAFDAISSSQVRDALFDRTSIKKISEAHQFLQTALVSNYEQDLFSYYKNQEFLILMAFLSYPFRGPGCLRSNIEPISIAASHLPELDILDYGAGIPYGILHLLRGGQANINSITLVDFDLVHAYLAEFMISRVAPDVEVCSIKVTNSDQIPDISVRKYNVIYGKDIFEHVHHPDILLGAMLRNAATDCIACLDLNDHGEKYLQHVSPVLSPLLPLVEKEGFRFVEKTGGVTIFSRSQHDAS